MESEDINKFTIKIEKAGTLDNALKNFNRYKINHLELIGEINYDDIRTIRKLASRQCCRIYNGNKLYGNLSILNLSKVRILRGGNFYLDFKPSYYDCFLKDDVIDYEMFNECDILSEIILPNSITDIGYSAFENCINLTSIIIPSNVNSIGPNAFKGCTNLASITFLDGIKCIGYSAFENCIKLATIEIPDTINNIAPYTFCNCLELTLVKLPNHMINVSIGAFQDCILLDNTNIKGYIKDYTSSVDYLHESIRNSVKKNILMQKDEILETINAAIKTRIIPIGENLKDEYISYKNQLVSKIRENLRLMPKRLFVNSEGVINITPKYSLNSDMQLVADIFTESTLSDFINRRELFKNTPLSNVILKPKDLKFNESDGTFSIKVERRTYTYEFDGDSGIDRVSVTEDPIIADTATAMENYRQAMFKGLQPIITKGTKQVDISKMSKKELVVYNKTVKMASLLQSITPEQMNNILDMGFGTTEAGFNSILENVLGTELDATMENVATKLSALRTDYINNKEGKSNC